MIISTFSVCLHLAAGEVGTRNEGAADILQMGCRVAALLPRGRAPVLQVRVVILKIKKKKKEINPPETASR